jgi:hydrogenase maturation protease
VDRPPGSLVRLEGRAVAPAVRERLSPHQVGVANLLDALELIGSQPRNLVLLGMVPASLDLHMGLSPVVTRHLPELVSALVEEIRRAGHRVEAVAALVS